MEGNRAGGRGSLPGLVFMFLTTTVGSQAVRRWSGLRGWTGGKKKRKGKNWVKDDLTRLGKGGEVGEQGEG